MSIEKIVGENIRSFRERLSMTQTELAEQVSVSQPAINRIEKGTKPPSMKMLESISDVLGCEPADLLSDIESA